MPDGHPRELIETVLDGFRAVAPGRLDDHHRPRRRHRAPGARPGRRHVPGRPAPAADLAAGRRPTPTLIAEAVAAARAADYAVVVVGDTVALTGESRSTATLELQGGQIALLDALAATGTPMIVVLLNSKPAALPPSALGAAAIIQAFNPGMRGGRADRRAAARA